MDVRVARAHAREAQDADGWASGGLQAEGTVSAAAGTASAFAATVIDTRSLQPGPHSAAPFLHAGNPRPVLVAAAALARRDTGTLAIVLEAEGSTYVRAGAMAAFDGASAPTGWLSGGCLEPALALQAAKADADGRIDWIEIDTREDADLFSGSAIGCRGRLRIALLPLRRLPGVADCLDAWIRGGVALQRALGADGQVRMQAPNQSHAWHLHATPPAWAGDATSWNLPLPRPPEVLLLGAGPETGPLLRLLEELGWRSTAIDPRERWHGLCAAADATSLPSAGLDGFDAALVMHHAFERDRDALELLANADVPFVGLLGPPRRRDDLLGLLTAAQRMALAPRLHAPVGLDLGGQGPEAIALSIAAQLQAWRARSGDA
jgi:xanthine dehydrogenase accessory factor